MRLARFLIALGLVLGVLAWHGPSNADPADPGSTVDSSVSDRGPATSSLGDSPVTSAQALQEGKPKRYSPQPGVVFNTAFGTRASRNKIFGKIIAAINHAPAKSRIRIMSWNIMSRTAVDALLQAQARGVKVRVLMDNTNLVDIPNPGFVRLKNSLKRGNQALPQQKRSYAKTCVGS
ncbi:MAG: phospholipase D-like domain-containing protein, partial [Nocardioides sp.]